MSRGNRIVFEKPANSFFINSTGGKFPNKVDIKLCICTAHWNKVMYPPKVGGYK
jgi:hypothetical protein